MPDILIRTGEAFQGTSTPTTLPNYLIHNNFMEATSQACVVDLTPPTFAGIATLNVESRGQIRAAWLAATDPTSPIRYEIYIKEATSTGLFNVSNIIAITDKLQYDTFCMPDGSFLVNGATYYVGIRAIDGVNNRDNNLVSLSVISTGVSVSADIYEVDGAFVINIDNKFQGTMWVLKNSVLATGSTLGTARYYIYDRDGNLVSGMSETGISANANGQFIITPVTSTLNKTLDHYLVKVQIIADGAERTGYVGLIEPIPEYEVHGSFSLDKDNKLNASFWATADDEVVSNLARLGTASYQVYDKDGGVVVGMSGSGISADSNGLYKITPVTSTLDLELNHYSVKVTISVDSILRTNFLPIIGSIAKYDIENQVSIDRLNYLQGAFWVVADGKIKTGSSLGTGAYAIYDYDGTPVIGLTESGIVADSDGRFTITSLLASTIDDPSHYSIKITVTADSVTRVFYKPLARPEDITYESKAQFAINAVNQLQGTFWAAVNGRVRTGSSLGAANYTVYDATGTPVAGLTQSGITADVNGRFQMSPVSAILLTDLTHYSVKIGIVVDGVERVSYKGFTLLGS